VFRFFADATNLEQLTPPFLRFRVRSMSTPTIQRGTEISYRLYLHGWPISWTSRIEAWDPPYGFTDVQIRGPFRLWHHDHEFTSEQGGTRLRDAVLYRAPFARLQRILRLSWVERDLEGIFRYRQQVIRRLFADTASQPSTHSC
jgi:ligand-binding SRPBCC domain-containing protein